MTRRSTTEPLGEHAFGTDHILAPAPASAHAERCQVRRHLIAGPVS